MARVSEPLLTRARAGDEAAFAAPRDQSGDGQDEREPGDGVKLQARDRAQLVVLAYEAGLVRPGFLA